jgi:hypothetical protein
MPPTRPWDDFCSRHAAGVRPLGRLPMRFLSFRANERGGRSNLPLGFNQTAERYRRPAMS